MYTRKDLEENTQAYDDNFNELIKGCDSENYREALRLENELNEKGKDIRRDLGLLAKSDCSIHRDCGDCTGYYIVVSAVGTSGKMYRMKMVEEETPNSHECPTKQIMNGGRKWKKKN